MSTTLAAVRSLYPAGMTFPDQHVRVDPARQAELARDYFAMPMHTDADRGHWLRMSLDTITQWEALRRLGFTMEVTAEDPYADHLEMFAEVERDRHIRVFATASTGGHAYFSDHQNDLFRAVHDIMGHYAGQVGFDRHGEEAAYLRHMTLYKASAVPALATETRGQNAGYVATGGFVDERITALPIRWHRAGALS